MRYPASMRMMAGVLIVALLSLQTVPCLAEAKDRTPKTRAAFLGIYFENTPAYVQQWLTRRIDSMLAGETSIAYLPPDQVREKVSAEEIQQALQHPEKEAMLQLAERLQVDYLFAGNLANQSRNQDRVLLVGELYRLDRQAGLFNRFEVTRYREKMGEDLEKFQKEYVQTIATQVQKKTLWPWLVVAGVALAGVIAMSLTSSRFNAEGQPKDTRPDKP